MDEGLEARTLPDSNAQLEGVQQQVDRLQRMVRISRLLSSTLDLDQLLQLIIQTAADMVGSEAASILLEDRRTGGLCFVAATNRSADELRCIEVPVDHSIAGTIYKTGEAAIVDNAMVDPRHYEEVDTRIEFQTRSILGVPLQVRNRNIGVLEAVNKCGGSCFSQEDVEILQTLASQAAVAIQNAKLVDDLRQANTRLAQIDKIKSDFLSIASHELRTPLNLVMGYAAMLREDASGTLSEEAEGVLRGATRLQGIIKSMTNLSYLESGVTQVKQERCLLQALVEDACKEWMPLASGKRLTLRQSAPEMPIYVNVDPSKISTVLNNLLDNAVAFTPSGGCIEVSIRPHTGMVAVSVADTGVGIPSGELERIFEPFYQVEDHLTRRHEGIGLGLSVAKSIVELHSGRIWAESVEGHGSRFTFMLPARWGH